MTPKKLSTCHRRLNLGSGSAASLVFLRSRLNSENARHSHSEAGRSSSGWSRR